MAYVEDKDARWDSKQQRHLLTSNVNGGGSKDNRMRIPIIKVAKKNKEGNQIYLNGIVMEI
jgi:hypothetical protein